MDDRARNDVEVILVGAELLRGERQDAHLAFLSRALCGIGARVSRAHVVGDDAHAIAALVSERLPHTRVIILTGGLGPTDDDVTREGVAEALDLPVEFDDGVWDTLAEFMRRKGFDATPANRRQAFFPRGATVIENPVGTAAGFRVDAAETALFVLPGPPRELQGMVSASVLPMLGTVFARPPLRVDMFRTHGIGESHIFELISQDTTQLQAYSVSWLPTLGGVDVVLTQRAGADAQRMDDESDHVHARLTDVLGTRYYERGQRPIAQVVGDLLIARNETVAVAESLTGGGIAHLLTDNPGASAYFLADVVAYSNESKSDFLGVRTETIEEFGAVSEETCTEMAHGIRRRARACWGIAATGIAGPTGGTPHKPVGLTFLGVAWDGGVQVKRVIFNGERATIRARAAYSALWLLYDQLRRRG